ncbi:MAG TPA: hypothetical protein PK490_04255 [Prosthecobacter sp.]|nr:hypothetical protein [Prosthecobacter sp.]HRK13475.1 hypothetical protein [Prosthecobacter sp.]
MNGELRGLRQPCCRFGVGAALLPGVDSRLRAELSDSATHSRSKPAGRRPGVFGELSAVVTLTLRRRTARLMRLARTSSQPGDLAKQTHPRSSAKAGRANATPGLLLALLASFVLVSCGKQEAAKHAVEAPKPAATSPAPVISDSRLDAEISQALTPTAAERDEGLADLAEDILDKYPNKNVTELLNVPEVNESLKVALTKLSENKALQNQINGTVALAAQMQGLNGEPGSTRLDLDTSNYDHARKSRLLQVVLSEDPRRIAGFIAQEIGEAVPELTFEGVDRASNGVAIRENAPPQK